MLQVLYLVIAIILFAFCWKYGGAKNHNVRRYGCPLVAGLYLYLVTYAILPAIVMAILCRIHPGYGMPDATDDGCYLARKFCDILKYDKLNLQMYQYIQVRTLVRGTCGFVYSLSILIPFWMLGYTNMGTYATILMLAIPYIVNLEMGEAEEVVIGVTYMLQIGLAYYGL